MQSRTYAAASENILILNPDCRVMAAAIEGLITVLRSADRVGMVGPLLLNPDGSEQAGGGGTDAVARLPGDYHGYRDAR